MDLQVSVKCQRKNVKKKYDFFTFMLWTDSFVSAVFICAYFCMHP